MTSRTAPRALATSGCLRLAAASLVLAAGLSAAPAAADYGFDIGYRATLSGLTIGRGWLSGRFEDGDYTLNAQGRTAGLAGLFTASTGEVQASGRLDGARSVDPVRFHAASSGRSDRSIRMALTGRQVRDVRIDPEPEPHDENHPARIRLGDEHKRGVIDPMSALVVPGGFENGGFRRDACDRTIPVFSGRERFDVSLHFKSVRTVSSRREGGYSGPVLVCEARYRPIAGHRSDRDGVKYLQERADAEVMLAPVPGTDVLVPYRLSLRTPYGPGVLQATSFAAR